MAWIMKNYGMVHMRDRVLPPSVGGSARFERFRGQFLGDMELKLRKLAAVRSAGYAQVVPVEGEPRTLRSYGMNIPHFKAKAIAYAMLKRSQSFLAFYSISFPRGMPDDVGYQVLNNVLTGMRKKFGLRSYMWVMERQKNGTLHYHLLTHDYMYIRDINNLVASCIDYYVENNMCSWGNSSRVKYNGVDVKAVIKKGTTRNPLSRSQIVDKVVRYLAKYMSKDCTSSEHRVWFCSRLVSALFTSVTFDHTEGAEIMDDIVRSGEQWKRVECMYCDIYFTVVIDKPWWVESVNRINDWVFEWFVINDSW